MTPVYGSCEYNVPLLGSFRCVVLQESYFDHISELPSVIDM